MAKEPGQEKSLHQLRQEVAHSRDRLARDLGALRYELDFPLKFRKSFQRQTVLWITAALVIGVAFAVMPARTRKVQVRARANSQNDPKEKILGAGLALGALKIAMTLLKPALTKIIANKMSGYATGPARKR